MPEIAIFDVDGTLVDSNYQHCLAWFRAFRRFGLTPPIWRIHQAIGMGGDRLVAAVAGQQAEDEHGDGIRAAWTEEFDPLLAEVVAFEGARELLAEVRRRGFRLVLASSGQPEHVEHYLGLLDAKGLAEAWTSASDVDQTKPAPDLLQVAMDKVAGDQVAGDQVAGDQVAGDQVGGDPAGGGKAAGDPAGGGKAADRVRVGGGSAVTVGDAVWDFQAAQRLGIAGIGVRTGGGCPQELREAGACYVYDSLPELTERLDETPMAAAGLTP